MGHQTKRRRPARASRQRRQALQRQANSSPRESWTGRASSTQFQKDYPNSKPRGRPKLRGDRLPYCLQETTRSDCQRGKVPRSRPKKEQLKESQRLFLAGDHDFQFLSYFLSPFLFYITT